jgi:hypothetical protein
MVKPSCIYSRVRTALVCLALLGFCLFAFGCAAPRIYSHQRDRNIIIDGKNEEWDDVKTYIMSKKVAVGAFDDDKFLYLYLVTWDPELRSRILHFGITTWFDVNGGQHKNLGIHFPAGVSVEQDELPEIEIMNGGDQRAMRMKADLMKNKGVEVKIGQAEQDAIYELKIPLRKSEETPYAIGVKSPGIVGVCFETSKAGMAGLAHPAGSGRANGRHERHGGLGHDQDASLGEHDNQESRDKPAEAGKFTEPQGLELWLTVELSGNSR